MIKKGQLYKGFRCLDVADVGECNSTGVWLRHEETGLEVFHLVNDDEENLFSFCFRTPSLDSTGCAHVLEHSVLNGSKKYPIKSPFDLMANQSVNTYLNAFTQADRTVYPSSSFVKADYFNLMSVYADAVFFPLLKPEVFAQEGHRLEFDENGKPTIQGVVYNEMKGAYSDFDAVCETEMVQTSLKDTSYGYYSGGIPEEIAKLSYSKFKAFHRKYYTPSNCLIFLYGNIPTEEQLDFFEENILSKNPQTGKAVKWEKFPKNFQMEKSIKSYGPAGEGTDTSKAQVNLLWLVSKDTKDRVRINLENIFLSHLLWGASSAPVRKALTDSELGTGFSPCSGYNPDLLFPETVVGLMGVNPSDAKKVKKVVYDTLKRICDEGISSEDLERTAMAFKFSNKEIIRVGGPYSLVYMRRAYRSWAYGVNPFEALRFSSEFDELYKKIKEDPSYISQMIHRYFLDNKDVTLYTFLPSTSWSKKKAKIEKDFAKELLSKTTKEKVLSELNSMHEYQQKEITEEEVNLIPRISVKDLSAKVEKVPMVCTEVDGVKCFINKQPTNGILYFNLAFPCDTLPAKEYPYLPFFASTANRMGWKDLSWDKATSLVLGKTGGIGCFVRPGTKPDVLSEEAMQKDYVGRDWVMYTFSVLEENMADAFELLSDCITGTRFDDKKHLKDLFNSMWNSFSSSVVDAAYYYSSLRSKCLLNRTSCVSEIFSGLTSLNTLKSLKDGDIDEISFHFRSILSKLRKGGAIIHMTGTGEGVSEAKKIIPSFIKKCGLKPLAPKYDSKDSDFFRLTVLPGETKKVSKKSDMLIDELIEIPGTVGFTALTMPGASFGTKESISALQFAMIASKFDLHEGIRYAGGAYGVYFTQDSFNASSTFITYRDPKPYESLFVFRDVMQRYANKKFSKEEVERSIIGLYSDNKSPLTPAEKGEQAIMSEMFGIDENYRKQKLKWLLSLKPKDIQEAAQNIAKNLESHRVVIICGSELISSKMKENARKIIELPI